MKIAGLILMVIIGIGNLSAQSTASVTGIVFDTISKKGLAYSTVSVVHEKDSSLVSFTRADSTGKFKLSGLPKGDYIINFSYVGYVPKWLPVKLTLAEQLDLGKVALNDLLNANNVTVTARRPPVTINNDTIDFNTENFKTQPNAVVEDLLKKLPGVTVDKDGTVKVNGQKVNRILVNGREIFTGDLKMVTKNLDADAVDKVQVFDKKSDRAEFTGMEDGQSEKTINLKLKKDRDNATFGRVSAGQGTNKRFDAQANLNNFKGDKQLTFIGMGNNTNKQGFSINDILNFTGDLARGMRNGGGVNIKLGGDDNGGLPISGMGPNQQGVADTYAGGLNYNNIWKKKTDLNMNGMFSDVNLITDRDINRKNVLPGNNFDYVSKSSNAKHNQQQRVNAILDQKIDSFTSVRFTPQLTFQNNNNRTISDYVSINDKGFKINEGTSKSSSISDAANFNSNLLFRHKFKKKGRTISSTTSLAYNSSKQDGTLKTTNRFYNAGIPLPDSIVNQSNLRDATTRSIGTNLIYTEPIGLKSLLEVNGFYNTNNGESKRDTYDYNGSNGKFDIKNTALSNDFRSIYNYGGGGASVRANFKKLSLTAGTNLQFSELESINNTNGFIINQKFTDLLPLINIQYKRKNTSSIGFNYNTSTSQPSTFQLQPVADISDPLNTYIGNPNLKRSYSHNLSVNMSSIDMFTQNNLFAFISYNQVNDAIVTSDVIKQNGARASRPINANGNFFLVGNLSAGFPVKKIKSNLDIGFSANISRNMSFVNGDPNAILNYSITPNFGYQFVLDTSFDISLSARINFNTAKYSLQPQLNNKFLQQVYGIDINNYFLGGFALNNNLDININSGRSDGFNATVPLWNVSFAKSFLKYKRGEFKISVFDLLNQNQGINRTANQNFIQDTRYNVLRRYFLFSFTYRLNRSAASNSGARVMIKAF
jgi:hypothetical protein